VTQVAGYNSHRLQAIRQKALQALDEPCDVARVLKRVADDLAGQRFGPLTLFHRLDRDTSGVVLLTRGSAINRYLDRAFKARTVEKTYLAVVMAGSRLAVEGTIDARVAPDPERRDRMIVVDRGGKAACTRYRVAAEQEGLQWVWLWPETGRTHQLRIHLAHLGAPILGDRLYHPHWRTAARLMLHARQIVLPPDQGYPARSFVAPWPEDFLALPEEGEA
jgi:23S rRNA pseudouridine1911/1915/1917 synthase